MSSAVPTAPCDQLAPPLANYADQVASESSRFAPKINQNSSSFHAFSQAEKTAFVKHINEALVGQRELSDKLPLDPESNDIFKAVTDGILLW